MDVVNVYEMCSPGVRVIFTYLVAVVTNSYYWCVLQVPKTLFHMPM